MEKVTLKPCPCCGGDVVLKQSDNGKLEWPICEGCQGTGLYNCWKTEDRQSAIEAWNTRATLPQSPALNRAGEA